jgi:alpha-galactosidase
MKYSALVLATLPGSSLANDNGLALTPPLGWRSWNLYGSHVSQDLIAGIMNGVVKPFAPTHESDGDVSLCDLGYCDVGLDDNWQACGSADAAPGMHYHDKNGNPLVNEKLFPDFKAMTDHAHSLNLTAGWYGNNCICSDHCSSPTECDMQIKADVAAMTKFNFDSWKLDGCGGEKDLVDFNKYMKAAGKPIMVENCHWGRVDPFKPNRSLPPAEGCPWNFYRSSGDVRASYASVIHNLGTVEPLRKDNLSYPGCWAYPDMLQVGCQHGPGGAGDPGLSPQETRSHFGAWAIVSSPLTLSHDVNNATVMHKIWNVISNTEVLAVNQAYVGDSGGVYASSDHTVELTDAYIEARLLTGEEKRVSASASQYLSKQLPGGKVAVLLMNSADATATLESDFSSIPGVTCTTCDVRDIWAHKDLGKMSNKISVSVESHDAAFLVIG